MPGSKTVKGETLNYTMQPLAKEFFYAISALQLLAANDCTVLRWFFPAVFEV
jgi:hypothetical protein